MPAEAVHLSALQDTLTGAPGPVAALVGRPELREAARLGAVFVDLPYFESFPRVLLNYLLNRPQRPSRWGDIFHHRTPIAVGRALGEAGAALQHSRATRSEGQYLQALALGYFSHAAVDTSAHPQINAMARERARRLGSTHGQQHQEVEKFQSILLHEQRFGFDFMGTATLREHIRIDMRPLLEPGPIASAVQAALLRCHGEAPDPGSVRSWVSGYRSYVRILVSPLGKTIAPPAAKRRARPELFDAVDFPARFAAAVAQSRRWVATLGDYLQDGRFDDSALTAFARAIPEGSIDPDLGPDPCPDPGSDPGSDPGPDPGSDPGSDLRPAPGPSPGPDSASR